MIRRSTCPICDRELPTIGPGEKSHVPFCSQRCQQIDFHRWWKGQYAIVDEVDPANPPRDIDPTDDDGS